jgi:cell division septation protein DedD
MPPEKKSSTVTDSSPPPAAATEQSTRVSKEEKTSESTYAVQLASFKDLDSAKKFVVQLKDMKPAPTIRTVNLPDTGRWHRVQVGQLSSRTEAAALADRLAAKYKLQAFVVSLGSQH